MSYELWCGFFSIFAQIQYFMKKIYFLVSLFTFGLGFSQNQTIFKDASFLSPALSYTNYQLANGAGANPIKINSIKRQSDGKLLVSGLFNNYNGNPVLSIVRLNEDGTLDPTFQLSHENFPATSIYKILIQSDNKILILAGQQYGNPAKLIRLQPDGARDFSYNESTFTQNYVPLCEMQADNKIVIAISTNSQINGVSNNGLVRLNADGTLDASFNSSLIFCTDYGSTSNFTDLKIDSNGKIVVVGGELFSPSCAIKHIIRLNPNGSEDATFTPPAEILTGNGYLKKVCILSDNKIIVTGNFNALTGTNNNNYIIKLNSNGTLDSSYSYGSGYGLYNLYAMAAQPDNKVVVFLKSGTLFNGTLVKEAFRINTDGSLDSSFDLGPTFVETGGHTFSEDLLVKPNGNIIIGGDYAVDGNLVSGLIEVNSNGVLNPNFSIGTGFRGNGYINKIQQLSSGKVLIAGAFDSVNGVTRHGLARLNSDGTYDTSFGGGTGFSLNAILRTFAVQPDGKIIVGGNFNQYNGVQNINLIRLNADGTIDPTFATVTSFYDSYIQGFVNPLINSIAVQNDGKILIGGAFVNYNGANKNNIMRLNTDGTLDTTFITGVGFNYQVTHMELQSDQKIVVAGVFTKYNNVTLTSKMIRLNAYGTRDTGFNLVGYTNFSVPRFSILPDGKILATKLQTSSQANGYELLKLNNDGTLDTSFSFNLDYTSILDFCIQPDNKILVVASSNNNVLKKISRFNDDGTLDTSFDIGAGISKNNYEDFAYGYLNYSASQYEIQDEANSKSLFMQNDGKILVAGYFTHFDNLPATGTLRLLNSLSYNLKGQTKLDQNNNGCDIADNVFPNLKFQVSSTNNNFNYTGNTTGNYNLGVIEGNYTVTPTFENPTYYTASPASVSVNFPTQLTPQLQNFCITPNGVHPDLELTLIPLSVARPGFDAYYKLIYKNKGNQIQSGTINIVFNDGVLDFVSANPATSSQSLNNLNWNFSNLNPFETRQIVFTLNANGPTETPSLNSGSVLNYTVAIISGSTDEIPGDNTFTLNQTVRNSFDPNDKTCLEGTSIALAKVGDYVHYLIRFENTGTYAAQNVSVRDIIDTSKYDVNSLVPTSGSHLFVTKVTDVNKVEFYFQNINISYEDASNDGYVAFKIKTKSTLVAGDSFSNSAGIYFDYNEAIITNIATTTVGLPLANTDVTFHYFTISPNPVKEILNITKNQNIELKSVSIYNTLGQLFQVYTNAQNLKSIDVSNLKTGNYIIKINSDKGILNAKFIKK